MENGGTRESRSGWLGALCILGLFCYLLVLPYVQGHWRLADDAYQGNLPGYVFQERVLKQDHAWPQWILNVGLGQPTQLSAGTTWFYPPQVLWGLTVGWGELSYLYYLLLHLVCGAMIAWAFGRQIGLSRAASLMAAMAYVGNGYVLGAFSNFNQIFPYLAWPLLLSGLVDLHREKSPWRGILKLEISFFVIEVICYPLLKILMVLTTAVGYWSMGREPGSWFRGLRWRPIFLAGVIAAVCAAPEWVSTFRVLGLADRFGVDFYDEAIYNSPTSFLSLVTALLPNLFQHRDVHELGVLWLERSWWLGPMTLLAIWLAIKERAGSFARLHVPAALAFAGFLFALGGHSFARELASAAMPPLSHLRHAVYGRFIPMAFLSFLGAFCLNRLETASEKRAAPSKGRGKEAAAAPPPGRNWLPWLWAAWAVALAATAISESETLFNAHAADLYSHPSAGWKLAALHAAFYLLLGYTFYARRTTLFGRWKWPAAIVLVQFVAMADAAYAFRWVIAREEPLRSTYEENFEVQSPHPNERSLRRWLDGDDWVQWYGNKPVLNAYNTPQHRNLAQAARDPRIQPLLGSLVSCQDGSPGLSCKGLDFKIDRFFGNVVQVSGQGASQAVIAVHDLYDPGWKAQVNGAPVEVIPVFDYLKGALVPPGRWILRFEYVNPLFPGLWYVSSVGLLLVLIGSRVIPTSWVRAGKGEAA